ncbi:MAG: hypothetical protein H6679_06000 [Epsilonproteobacteria bacterium]|nr:hypothetical protein [Campylobacterota bacterium]
MIKVNQDTSILIQDPATLPLSPLSLNAHNITFSISQISSHIYRININIPKNIVLFLKSITIELFKNDHFEGFEAQTAPQEYIEEVYKNEIDYKIKNYLLKHIVIDFIYQEILKKKIRLVNYPRLAGITSNPDKGITYLFDYSTSDLMELKEWRHFAFKSPKRKKYKDLDKQVISFIEQHCPPEKNFKKNVTVEEGDWAYFTAILLNKNSHSLKPPLMSSFWIKIKNNHLQDPFATLFIGKRMGDSFISNKFEINKSFNELDTKRYNFYITIQNLSKGKYFLIDTFKTTFKLKNIAEIHNKLMEVFSYRNDLSQRKTIIEEIFHLLLSKHRFEIPKHLVVRREEDLLRAISQQPDYHVYKAQKDFYEQVSLLAEKQLKEEIIIDHIAYHDNITVSTKDAQNYLHLFNHKRLKEFVYFKPYLQKIEDPDAPISSHILNQTIIREKTLNHIVHALTK